MQKVLVSWLVVIALFVSSVAVFGGDYSEGFEDGRTAAKEDSNAVFQVIGGASFGIFYILGSAVFGGKNPSETRMLSIRDRSADYQRAYRESYSEQWKKARTNNGWIGMGLLFCLLVATAGL